MIRLGVSVEGATEREFVTRCLAPHLINHGVLATPIPLTGPPNLDRIRAELKRLLPSFDRVSTLYDYYGFQRREARSPDELLDAISAAAPTPEAVRVIPYVQVYEFEALVFSNPTEVAQLLDDASLALRRSIVDELLSGTRRTAGAVGPLPGVGV